MKSLTVIVFLFLIHANLCSFFNIMDDAVVSVREEFDNLFEDNSVTIDCTIFAVEQLVLSDNSYLERCQQQIENNNRMGQYEDSNTDIVSQLDTVYQERNNNLNNLESISSVTKTDITKVNYPKKSDVLLKLESMQASLRGETGHLMDIDSYLRQKLNKFSFDMNDKFNETAPLENSSVLEDIWSNLQIIREQQNGDKISDPKVVDIENMVNKIIEISNKNTTNDLKIDNIIDSLAIDITSEKLINSNLVSKTMEDLKNKISIENLLTTESPTITVDSGNKEIIGGRKGIIADTINTGIKDAVIVPAHNNALPPLTDAETLIKPQTIQDNNNLDLINDLETGFNDQETLPLARTSEARKIMREYQHSEDIMEKYFNNPNNIVTELTGQDSDDFFNDDFFKT